jgi:N-acetylneuraminate synthase
LIVAELSGNHHQDLGEALALIDAAVDAGADAVKIQTYTAKSITIDSDRPAFTLSSGPWAGSTLSELYESAHTPWEWHERLFAHATDRGIPLFSSPFDPAAVDHLETLGCPAYKIASFEAVDLPLIARAAATGKPLIVSTGMTSSEEIHEVVATVGAAKGAGLILLHCVSAYPAPLDETNLRTIPEMAQAFSVPVGLSDHTLGQTAAIAAVAVGAVLIEKHLTLSRAAGGPDSSFSMEPSEFRSMAEAARDAWISMGTIHYGPTPSSMSNVDLRRSLYVVEDMAAGESFTIANVRSIRPAEGLAPKHLPEVIGRRSTRVIGRGTPLVWDMVGPADPV